MNVIKRENGYVMVNGLLGGLMKLKKINKWQPWEMILVLALNTCSTMFSAKALFSSEDSLAKQEKKKQHKI